MIIGIDFDNTIADYTGVFHRVAVNLGWLPESVGVSKNEVKQYFLDNDNEDHWTELQGKVYGTYIGEAKPYPGVKEFISKALVAGNRVFVVSHKTRYPYIGDKVDFHLAAKNWLNQQGFFELISEQDCSFNETKEQKLQQAAQLNCDIFFDDLTSILRHELFPISCQPVLFNSHMTTLDNPSGDVDKLTTIRHWSEADKFLDV